MIKSLFFDNDGVLVSTEHLVFEANCEVLESLGVAYSLDDFIDHTLLTGKGSWGFLKDCGFDEESYKEFLKLRKTIWYEKLRSQNHAIQGTYESLEKLAHLDLVITTSAKEEVFKLSHEKSGLLDYFSSFITREHYSKIKPAPDIYLKALGDSNYFTENILVVEDTPRGIQSAKSAGLTAVAIPHQLTVGLDFSGADYILDGISELPLLVQKINSETL